MGSTSGDNTVAVVDRRRKSSAQRTERVSPQPHPSPAEVALNVIAGFLEGHKDNNKPQRSHSQTDSDDARTVDTELSIDHNIQLITKIAEVVKNYQIEKDLSWSCTAEEGLDDIIKLSGGSAGAQLITRASNTEANEFDIQQVNENTHPTIHTDAHVDRFGNFVDEMLAAGRRQNRTLRYTNVKVLMMSWEENTNDKDKHVKMVNAMIEEEIKTMYELFHKTLRYSVERFAIPLVRPQSKVQRKVTEFVDDYSNSETLLIIYYNGHGSYHDNSCFWHPTEEASEVRSGYRADLQFYGAHLEWNQIQNSTSPDGDLLIVLDCCYAGASLLNANKGRLSTTQILTACGKGQKTPAGENSFTMRFVKAVNDMLAASKTRISITELYGVMVGQRLGPQPFHVQRGSGNIVIEQLPDPNTPGPEVEVDQFLGVDDQGKAVSRGSSLSGSDDKTIFSNGLKPGGALTDPSSVNSSASSLMVTLMFRTREEVEPDAAVWANVVKALPAEAAAELADVKVHVEAAMPTNSTMMIVTIPMVYWLMLPESPAYTFLGFVKGYNKLLTDKPARKLELEVQHNDLRSAKRTDSDEPEFIKDGEADLVHELIDAVVQFFDITRSSNHVKERRPGRFHQMATKVGFHPSSSKTSKLESDPHFVTIRRLAQKLVIVRNAKGETTGLSYDLHFTEIARLFELKKKSVKETIHKVDPRNGGELEATIATEFDELEKEVLTKLEEEKGKVYAVDTRVPSDQVKNASKGHTKSRSNVSKLGPEPASTIPENSILASSRTTTQSTLSKPNPERKESLISTSLRGSSARTDSIESRSSSNKGKRTDSGFGSSGASLSLRPNLGTWRRKSSSVTIKELGDSGVQRPVGLRTGFGRGVRA